MSLSPSDSPKLHAIEPWFGGIKDHDPPERRYPTLAALTAGVDEVFERVEARAVAVCNS